MPLANIPKDVWQSHLLPFLEPHEVRKLALTCKQSLAYTVFQLQQWQKLVEPCQMLIPDTYYAQTDSLALDFYIDFYLKYGQKGINFFIWYTSHTRFNRGDMLWRRDLMSCHLPLKCFLPYLHCLLYDPKEDFLTVRGADLILYQWSVYEAFGLIYPFAFNPRFQRLRILHTAVRSVQELPAFYEQSIAKILLPTTYEIPAFDSRTPEPNWNSILWCPLPIRITSDNAPTLNLNQFKRLPPLEGWIQIRQRNVQVCTETECRYQYNDAASNECHPFVIKDNWFFDINEDVRRHAIYCQSYMDRIRKKKNNVTFM